MRYQILGAEEWNFGLVLKRPKIVQHGLSQIGEPVVTLEPGGDEDFEPA